ncbi:uncharacterized protein BJX67DRAFT_326838 [Aspergillus lucknowensis]|uniref:Uncharacterized protein n=1 Tax=Aspergillus lucknowensis TaxID=176173 RepID=A0ABR4L8J1_9EURO
MNFTTLPRGLDPILPLFRQQPIPIPTIHRTPHPISRIITEDINIKKRVAACAKPSTSWTVSRAEPSEMHRRLSVQNKMNQALASKQTSKFSYTLTLGEGLYNARELRREFRILRDASEALKMDRGWRSFDILSKMNGGVSVCDMRRLLPMGGT